MSGPSPVGRAGRRSGPMMEAVRTADGATTAHAVGAGRGAGRRGGRPAGRRPLLAPVARRAGPGRRPTGSIDLLADRIGAGAGGHARRRGHRLRACATSRTGAPGPWGRSTPATSSRGPGGWVSAVSCWTPRCRGWRTQGCGGVDGIALPGDRGAKNFYESAGFKATAADHAPPVRLIDRRTVVAAARRRRSGRPAAGSRPGRHRATGTGRRGDGDPHQPGQFGHVPRRLAGRGQQLLVGPVREVRPA